MAQSPTRSRARTGPKKSDGDKGGAALGYARPRTYEELRAVLSSGTVHFPKRLRQVAIFLWQHPSDVALGTISSVAGQAGVQPSTLVRFAKTFGFAGFSDFQEIFKEHIKGSWPEGRERNGSARLHRWPDQRQPPFRQRAGRRVAGIARPHRRAGFDVDGFERMIAIMADADLIHVIGSKRAFPVTTYVSLALSQQGVRNVLVDNVGSTAFDQIGCVGERDAVLAVSFSPYNSITPELVAAARERKAPDRIDHRQHLQSAGQAVRRLGRSDRVGLRRLPFARRDACRRHGTGHGVVARRSA